ncbi:hypothetical protein JVT61DRAFT_6297 [Boletus reticuloceps]|uniref:Uncharacterized protein n=1 Tax=Boletus reticuloceps TaxID=495285 RepID=A0A8I3A6S1_9AGAM|nr:hypothetical protein JVT61DRAFT_6297 [Boletus reticuloceps]
MTRRFIKYFVRGLHPEDLRPVALSVSNESNMLSIVEDSHDLISASASTAAIKVAYLPKNVAVSLNIESFCNHPDWFAAIASHLKYPDETCNILSLDLYGERDCDNVQFFIEHHPDQPEFNLPKEEQDHQRIIEYAGSNALENKLTAASTSEYMAYPDFIYNGRPAGCMGPPITIYEEVFADITDDLAHLEDLPDSNQDILDEIGDFANQSLQTYSST